MGCGVTYLSGRLIDLDCDLLLLTCTGWYFRFVGETSVGLKRWRWRYMGFSWLFCSAQWAECDAGFCAAWSARLKVRAVGCRSRLGSGACSAGVDALPEQVVVGGCEAGQPEAVGQAVEEGGLLRACQGVRGQAVEGRGEAADSRGRGLARRAPGWGGHVVRVRTAGLLKAWAVNGCWVVCGGLSGCGAGSAPRRGGPARWSPAASL